MSRSPRRTDPTAEAVGEPPGDLLGGRHRLDDAPLLERLVAKALVVDQALGSEAIEKGMVERRLRRRAQARSSLDRAVELFDAMGASRWATLARAELEGLGQRPAPMG